MARLGFLDAVLKNSPAKSGNAIEAHPDDEGNISLIHNGTPTQSCGPPRELTELLRQPRRGLGLRHVDEVLVMAPGDMRPAVDHELSKRRDLLLDVRGNGDLPIRQAVEENAH